MSDKCYIMSAVQVSCQSPLSEEWIDAPQAIGPGEAPAVEPDSRGFISPAMGRRMGKLLRRAVCTSLAALAKGGVAAPDAIICGTGMGCLDSTEKFLADMAERGESGLKPTLFMQSTHNTIASQIAMALGCHSYNSTYSHEGISFGCALLDAWLQITGGEATTALVGGHDELTPLMARILRHTHPEYAVLSEASVATLLSRNPASAAPLCRLENVEVMHSPTAAEVAAACRCHDGFVMAGLNGNPLNDEPYIRVAEIAGMPLASHAGIFGCGPSHDALAFYAAAHILSRREMPRQMWVVAPESGRIPGRVKVVCHSGGTEWEVITLESEASCGGC